MDTLASPNDYYGLATQLSDDIYERLLPLLDERQFCLLKLKQLKINNGQKEEIALLERIIRQDDRRVKELMLEGKDPVFPTGLQ
jgi:hypothetical protein